MASPIRTMMTRHWRRLRHFGQSAFCTSCHSHLRAFHPFGQPARPHARCPVCGALERHRFLLHYLRGDAAAPVRSSQAILHIAPEPFMVEFFTSLRPRLYITGDLLDPGAMCKVDLTAIDFPDSHFDLLYCSHVLEHIPDDRRAMREMHRVLRPGGIALVMVPLRSGPTLEDPTVNTPEERLRRFGQHDHVRVYGEQDLPLRLSEEGFALEAVSAVSTVPPEDFKRFGFHRSDVLFVCRRGAG